MAGRLEGWGVLPIQQSEVSGGEEGGGWGSRGDDHIGDWGEVEGRGGERTNEKGRGWCGKAKLEVS